MPKQGTNPRNTVGCHPEKFAVKTSIEEVDI